MRPEIIYTATGIQVEMWADGEGHVKGELTHQQCIEIGNYNDALEEKEFLDRFRADRLRREGAI